MSRSPHSAAVSGYCSSIAAPTTTTPYWPFWGKATLVKVGLLPCPPAPLFPVPEFDPAFPELARLATFVPFALPAAPADFPDAPWLFRGPFSLPLLDGSPVPA